MQNLYDRVDRKLHREGLRGSVESLYRRIREKVAFDETHYWFERALLDIEPISGVEMQQGSELVSGTARDVDLLEQIPAVSLTESLRRLAQGNSVWMAVKDGKPAFSCWTLYGEVPVVAAPGGSMPIPPDVVMIEDAVALPGLRNQGLGRCTLQNVMRIQQDVGYSSLITRTLDENIPPQKLATKLGFCKIASNHYRRIGLRTYGYVVHRDVRMGRWIAEKLRL